MALVIPKVTVYQSERGQRGTGVWVVQRLLNRIGYPTSEDADFGPQTETNVKKFQVRLGFTGAAVDGKVGQKTQGKITHYLTDKEETQNAGLPDDLLISKIMYESSGYLASVNWSVAGGVDCGVTQRRVYEADYSNDTVVKRAFDAAYQVDLSAGRMLELFGIFFNDTNRSGTRGKRELAWRCATLNHNYPGLADKISRVGVGGLSSYYTTQQSWVTRHRLTFPDGAPVRTPLEWGQRYALGNLNHREPGQATKLVRSWG